MAEDYELEISVNIGNQKYLINVPKNADLSELVLRFLRENNLNQKLQSSIIRLVKSKLTTQNLAQQNTKKEQLNDKNKSNKIEKGEMVKPQPQQIIPEQTVSNSKKLKNIFIQKIQQQIQANNSNEKAPESRKVYEQWKQKQKEKNSKINKNQNPVNTSRINSARERHSPDYFYKKGLKFREDNQQNCESQFKRLYPFKVTQKHISQEQKQKLYSRLYKQKKQFNHKAFLEQRHQQLAGPNQNKKMDPIKRYVKEQDDKIDKKIFKLLKEGSLTPAKSVRSISKSPFRKTLIR